MITASIDVSKIDKGALYEGKKGTYLDIVLIETPDSQYGNDFMVVQGLSKERRDAGEKGAILGNGKVLRRRGEGEAAQGGGDEGLPF